MQSTARLLQSQRFSKSLPNLISSIQIATTGSGHTRTQLIESQDPTVQLPQISYTLRNSHSQSQVRWNESAALKVLVTTPPNAPPLPGRSTELVDLTITVPKNTKLSHFSLKGSATSDLEIPGPGPSTNQLTVNVDSGNTHLESHSTGLLNINTNHGFITLGDKVQATRAQLYTHLGDISGALRKFTEVKAHTNRGTIALELEAGVRVGSEIKATSGFGDVKLRVNGFTGNVVAQSSGQPVVTVVEGDGKERTLVLPVVEKVEVPGEVVVTVGDGGSGTILGTAEKGKLTLALGV
ncbi:hypothetical protein BDR26DRAFT_932723 [Obelidium mucronatum]|nr:hypothetical protein BDR26DRAFT_932723 [Obelidium mucronatum]